MRIKLDEIFALISSATPVRVVSSEDDREVEIGEGKTVRDVIEFWNQDLLEDSCVTDICAEDDVVVLTVSPYENEDDDPFEN